MYRLIFDPEAAKALEKMPQSVSHRIYKKLHNCKPDPYRFFIRLKNRKEYKLRVGNYRVIADIKDEKVIILILMVDHRRRVYKR